jgi:hypothetical protein
LLAAGASTSPRDKGHKRQRIDEKSTRPYPPRATENRRPSGQRTRAPLKADELNAMALGKSSRPTHLDFERLAHGNVEGVHDATNSVSSANMHTCVILKKTISQPERVRAMRWLH